MVETLEAVVAHLSRQDGPAKVVVWAHNSHLEDARATDMNQRGELNVGQLVREKYGRDAVLVGFTTHHGTVTAAADGGGVAERKRIRPALPGSCEALFHSALAGRFLLAWRSGGAVGDALGDPRLERAIGAIYRPEAERVSHYFHARLPQQFDAVLHFDETRAVERLARWGPDLAGPALAYVEAPTLLIVGGDGLRHLGRQETPLTRSALERGGTP